MKLYELIRVVDFEYVWECLQLTEGAKEETKPYAQEAFEELKKLKPDTSEPFTIEIERVSEFNGEFDQTQYYDVSSLHPDEEESYRKQSIAHLRWRLWLWADISSDTLNKFICNDIVAHCLWEMTWYGFSNRKQQERVRSMFRSSDRVMKEYKEENK